MTHSRTGIRNSLDRIKPWFFSYHILWSLVKYKVSPHLVNFKIPVFIEKNLCINGPRQFKLVLFKTRGGGARGFVSHPVLTCSCIHSLTHSFYTHGRFTGTRLWLLPLGRPLQGDSLEVVRSWVHPPFWGVRCAGKVDLPPGWWTWGPGGPAFPGLWGWPAIRPAGSRGQCPDANGGSSCCQAGLRC